MRSLQRDRSTKNTCETLILVSGPTQEHVDLDLSDFVVPVQQAVVPGKEKDTRVTCKQLVR
jgi:hypothetical protein